MLSLARVDVAKPSELMSTVLSPLTRNSNVVLIAALPTSAHSLRLMRARSNKNSAMSRFDQPAFWICSRNCFGMMIA